MNVPRPSHSDGCRDAGAAGEQPRVYQVWGGNNVFFLQGRFIFGPDARSLFLTISLIIAPVVTFCVFVGRHLVYDFPGHWGLSVIVVAVVFTIYDLMLLLLTSGRDPGIIPRNTYPPEPEGIDGSSDIGGQTPQEFRLPRTKDVIVNGICVRVKYCDTCMLYRPPRCSHCSICNNCVERFDHHCPWVGQCIGKRNYRFFYMFVFSTMLLCLYVFAFCWVYLIKIRDAEHLSIWKAMLKTPASVVLVIYCFLCVWFVGGLSVFHFYLMSTNQTTYENFRYRYDRRANPYSRGIMNNILDIFCTAIPPSKNNFRARVTLEEGLQQARAPSRGFMSPSMGNMGRKPVPWDETPRTAVDFRDLEAGLGGLLDEKDGRICHASPDLSSDDLEGEVDIRGLLDEKDGRVGHASPDLSSDDLREEFTEGEVGMYSSQSSWGHRTGTSGSMDSISLQMAAGEANGGCHVTRSGTRSDRNAE